jgi:hypothetical protein
MFPSVSQSVTPYSAEPDQELLLELSARLFGSEVGWFSFHHNAKDAAKEIFDSSFDLVDKIVKKAKDFDVSTGVVFLFTHSSYLLCNIAHYLEADNVFPLTFHFLSTG